MAAAQGGSGGGGSSNDNDFGRLYAAVERGESEARVRAIIESFGSDESRRRAIIFTVKKRFSYAYDEADDTPLACAARRERGDLVGALLEAGADPDGPPFYGRFNNPLALCIAYDRVQSLRVLVSSGRCDPKQPIRRGDNGSDDCASTAAHLCFVSPPFTVAQRPQLACLQTLVREFGVDVNALDSQGATPLTKVASLDEDHEAAVDVLLELGADPNKGGQLAPAVRWSFWSDLYKFEPHVVQCLRKIVAAGARLTGLGEGVTPPLVAAASGSAKAVRFLLEQGVPVDEREASTGQTALHQCTSEDAAVALLEASADIEALDAKGRTPIFPREYQFDEAVTCVLLARGASPDVKDQEGTTPLMAACTPDECEPEWDCHSDCSVAVVLLRHSSPETVRAVRESDGFSAADCIVNWVFENRFDLAEEYRYDTFEGTDGDVHLADPPPLHLLLNAHQRSLLSDLLRAGAPVAPQHADKVLPFVASHMLPAQQRAEIEMARRRRPSNRWRGVDEVVQLAFDFVELREDEAAVARLEARERELEEELRALGVGTEDTEGDEEKKEVEEEGGDEDDDGEQGQSGAGGSEEEEEEQSGAGSGSGGEGAAAAPPSSLPAS